MNGFRPETPEEWAELQRLQDEAFANHKPPTLAEVEEFISGTLLDPKTDKDEEA